MPCFPLNSGGGVALGLLVLYLAVGFGLRAAILYHRTGSLGLHGVQGAFGSVEWIAGMLFVVGLLAGGAAAIGDMLHLMKPAPFLTGPVVRTVALVVFWLGFLATFGAQMALGDSWRVGVPRDEHTALVTNGPFAWVRNPIFTAMLISAAGLLLLVPNLAALGAWTAMLVGLEIHVRLVEEPHLLNMHGDAYAKYAARVGRFWPYLGRLR